MANRIYNKQGSPKGYKDGGMTKGVKEDPRRDQMKQPLKKAGPKAGRPKAGGPKLTPSKQQRKMGAGESAKRKRPEIILLSAQKEGPAKKFTTIKEIPMNFKRGGGVDVKKAKEFRKNRKTPIRTFLKNTMEGKYMDPRKSTVDPRDVVGNRRVRRKMGGSLKPVDPKTQKGLSKLPTEVRNKMGYMKKGGKVHGK